MSCFKHERNKRPQQIAREKCECKKKSIELTEPSLDSSQEEQQGTEIVIEVAEGKRRRVLRGSDGRRLAPFDDIFKQIRGPFFYEGKGGC